MIRVSTIDTFRLVCTTDWKPESELIHYIRAGQMSEPNWRMSAGTAWHALLEGRPTNKHWTFRPGDVEAAKSWIGHGLQEVTGYREIAGVTIKGTCDWWRGLILQDHKLKFSTPDAKDYEPSLQWRFYLAIFEAEVLRYNLFRAVEPDNPEAGGQVDVLDCVSFNVWRYVGMEDELAFWVDRFRLWAVQLGLWDLLAQHERAAA